MKRGTVLITDGVHPLMFDGLKEMGFTCDYQPDISLEEVHQIIHEYEGIIINSKIIMDKRMFDNAKKLTFLGRLGSGMEIVDIPYAESKGIHVISAPEGNCNAVAEHALGMLLALANKFIQADREVRMKHWDREKNRGFELQGKTIGIIGFGHTGSAFASKLSGMGMDILAYDKYKSHYTFGHPLVKETSLEEIQDQADIISFHLPLTAEIHHYIDADFISKCKKGVILINTSRGKVVDTNALIQTLENGQVGGACLDVFENEKPHTFSKKEHEMYDRLYQFPNTILTPHVAGWTVESKARLSEVILGKLRKVL